MERLNYIKETNFPNYILRQLSKGNEVSLNPEAFEGELMSLKVNEIKFDEEWTYVTLMWKISWRFNSPEERILIRWDSSKEEFPSEGCYGSSVGLVKYAREEFSDTLWTQLVSLQAYYASQRLLDVEPDATGKHKNRLFDKDKAWFIPVSGVAFTGKGQKARNPKYGGSVLMDKLNVPLEGGEWHGHGFSLTLATMSGEGTEYQDPGFKPGVDFYTPKKDEDGDKVPSQGTEVETPTTTKSRGKAGAIDKYVDI